MGNRRGNASRVSDVCTAGVSTAGLSVNTVGKRFVLANSMIFARWVFVMGSGRMRSAFGTSLAYTFELVVKILGTPYLRRLNLYMQRPCGQPRILEL